MEALQTASSPEKAERPWLLRHAGAVLFAVLFTGFWIFANYSGMPGLMRLNEKSPPAGATIKKHLVYGWPIAGRQEMETVAPGGGTSGSSHSMGDVFVLNIPLGVMMVLVVFFLADWSRTRRERAVLSSTPMTEDLRQRLDEQRYAFRARWFWVLRCLFALFIAGIGILILYGCIRGMQWQATEASALYAEAVTSVQRKGANSRSIRGSGGNTTAVLAIGMLGGCIFILGALLLIVRRYRLWMAVTAVLFAGLMGSLPFLCVPASMSNKSLVSFGFESNLSDAQLETIRSMLKPAAVEKTLSESTRKETPTSLGLRDVLVEGKAEDGGAGVRLVLEFDPRMDGETRATVFCLYYEYLYQLTARAVKAQGMGALGADGGINIGSQSWPQIRKDWLDARQHELDALFQPQP